MPRVLRKSKLRRAQYDEHDIDYLLRGVALTHLHGFGHPRTGERTEEMREAWEALRDTLLPQWIAAHPGTRPYAWWVLDAPERRQRTDGVVHPFDDHIRQKHVEEVCKRFHGFREIAYGLFYGKPHCLCVPDDFEAEYETQLQYLTRLGLLTDQEKELLA